jgi:hypothetical protein
MLGQKIQIGTMMEMILEMKINKQKIFVKRSFQIVVLRAERLVERIKPLTQIKMKEKAINQCSQNNSNNLPKESQNDDKKGERGCQSKNRLTDNVPEEDLVR